MGTIGFSYIGLIFLIMLFVPNIMWTKAKPIGYSSENEIKILAFLEKLGEVLTTCTALVFSDTNISIQSLWSLWLVGAAGCMILYEIWWIKYFKSEKKLSDFYSGIIGIPLAGATLPVVAFIMLGIYGKVAIIIISAVILGIGHIGIHYNHQKDLK